MIIPSIQPTKRLLLLGAILAVSTGATAGEVNETGIGYMYQDSRVDTVTSDGLIYSEDSSHGVWLVEGLPEGYPTVYRGGCTGSWLTSEQGANFGSSWRCKATDNDGDGFFNVGSLTAPDWSDCSFKIVAGWGKFSGMTGEGNCQPLGPFAGQDTSSYSWTSVWHLPD